MADHMPEGPAAKAALGALDATYGITHPDDVAALEPGITAAYQALTGLPHQAAALDTILRRQLRHSLAVDGRPATKTEDIAWDLTVPGQRPNRKQSQRPTSQQP